jgi:polyisoprenoid-binding protein YceI
MSLISYSKFPTVLAFAALVLSAAPVGISLAQNDPATALAPGLATYKVEPTHTFITWEAKHFGTSTSRGRFEKKDGTINIDTIAKTGKAEIVIDMKSNTTGVEPFDKHLAGKDFFKSDEFPTATFKGDQFKFDGEKVTEVVGTLTMLGKTLPLSLKASGYNCYMSPMIKKQVCGGDFEATVKRSEYGMNYGVPFIPDNIRLLIQIEAIRQ